MKKIALCCMAALTAAACHEDGENAMPSQLVVEGWIEEGQFPVVQLMHSIPITFDYQKIDDLGQYVERWARVTISDGTREVVMAAKPDRRYMPPYIYTTSYMRGERGKSYRLKVVYGNGGYAEATTSIPAKATLDSIWIAPVASSDTLFQIRGRITPEADSIQGEQYYKLFSSIGVNSRQYLSSYLGVVSSSMLNADREIPINKGRNNLETYFTPYYTHGDTVFIKIARIDKTAYDFWHSFEDMATLSRNPLFPMNDNLPSNINGALGYWFGYGSSFYSIVVP